MFNPVFSVFTLSHPAQPHEVRFVGMTSQTLPKRIGDMISGARKEHSAYYETAVAKWLRELNNLSLRPHYEIWFETKDRDQAVEWYKATVNQFLETGVLLNMKPGQIGGQPRVDPIADETQIGGRQVDLDRPNAKVQAERKA